MRKFHASILLAVLVLSSAPLRGASPEDTFNQERLKAGQSLYLSKQYLDAIAQLHVAAFGYLSKPPALSECLVWLALAQTAAGKSADADATIGRFLEVERRFPSYPAASLPPEIRAEFRTLLTHRVAEATLLSMPSLAGLVEGPEQKYAKLPPAERRKALEAQAKAEPLAVRWPIALASAALNEGDSKGAEKWATQTLSIEAGNPDALALRARAREARGDYAGALTDLGFLAPAEVEKRPDLYAVRFVSLVETADWTSAQDAAKKVPERLASRTDVVDAQRKLSAEEQRRTRQASAAAAAAAPKASTASAPKPSSRPSKPAPPPPAVSPTPVPAAAAKPAPAAPSATEISARSDAALAESRKLVTSGKAAEAEKVLNDAIKVDPANRDLRLALLEAACLTRSYQIGMAQIAAVEPFGDVEAPSMFYAAVVLYESGHPREARSYMERSAQKVSGPLVDEYSKKILGQN
jgi:tetratricopeptide (TPR) repeat protein